MWSEDAVLEYLNERQWLILDDTAEAEPLEETTGHAGFRVEVGGAYGREAYRLRLYGPSPWGLPNQAEYEYAVLKFLVRSQATPRPFYYDNGPAKAEGGGLLAEWLEGEPLDPASAADLGLAANIYAAVHALPVHDEFICQPNPMRLFAGASPELEALAEEWEKRFGEISPALTHGPVSSTDFALDADEEQRGLSNWDRGAITDPAMDLAWFIHGCLGGSGTRAMVEAYCRAAGCEPDVIAERVEFCIRAVTILEK